jgi:hypothetical protein
MTKPAPLTPATTFNSLFAPLVGTPCSNQNRGDPFVFYDHLADCWVISDFAFASFPGTNLYQCIAVSQTGDPVPGGWHLYALLADATNLNDYPKMALWNNPQPGGAYHLTVNLFLNNFTFSGVKVFALDRGSMLSGGARQRHLFSDPSRPGWVIPTDWCLRAFARAIHRLLEEMSFSSPLTAPPTEA